MDQTSVTPCLSSTAGYLNDVRTQILALLQFVIYNPGWTSSQWNEYTISLRGLIAQYENDRTQLATNFSHNFSNLLISKFRDYDFDVDVTTEDYDPKNKGDSSYTLKINIMMKKKGNTEYMPAIIAGTIDVNQETNEISIKYDSASDNTILQ